MRREFLLFLPLLALACEDKSKTAAPADSASASSASMAAAPVELTVLVTADENGHLLPEGDPAKGGAAATAGKWAADEKYCGGPEAQCEPTTSIAFSCGDHFSGPAISSYFRGESTAEVMKAMGYRASSFGNHDFDYGEDGFAKFVSTSGIKHVAANVAAKAGSPIDKSLSPYVVIPRAGVKIGVIGIASLDTASKTMAERMAGSTISPIEASLADVVPKVWKDGADAIVVLSHDCPDAMKPIFDKHADWHVSLVAGAHCQKLEQVTAGGATLASPGRDFQTYLRAKLKVDRSKPSGQRVTEVKAERVEVGAAKPDPQVQGVVEKWKKDLDSKLSQEIGYTAKGLEKRSPELYRVVLGAIRKQLGVDYVIANKKGFRDGIPAGKVTAASIYSAIPYENSVLTLSLTGEQLKKELARESAVSDSDGKPLDPKKKYKVATLDFLYFGGDGFELEKMDPNGEETGMVWQTPVIEYLQKNKTTPEKPLEAQK